MSWPKRLKNAASWVSIDTFSSAGSSPSAPSALVACGSRLMPTPSGRISGAASKTRQAMPRRCSSSASVRPPTPAPMMRTSITASLLRTRYTSGHENPLDRCSRAGARRRIGRRRRPEAGKEAGREVGQERVPEGRIVGRRLGEPQQDLGHAEEEEGREEVASAPGGRGEAGPAREEGEAAERRDRAEPF